MNIVNMGQMGLNSKIKERVFDARLEANTILYFFYDGKKLTQEDIDKGVEVPDGSTLEVVVTEKGGLMVASPDLVCMKYKEARFLLNNYNLSIGSIINDATVTDQDEAYVWKQLPMFTPSQQVRIGGQYDVYLTQYRPDDCPF